MEHPSQVLEGNILIYGAPGTGKSHDLEEFAKHDGKHVIRTVFHSEYSYFDFVGSYKPAPLYKVLDSNGQNSSSTYESKGGVKKEIGEPVIDYQFVPGPFTVALVNALTHPKWDVCLIIEEINRANAAAVFGDIFQLLDRKNGTGESVYAITPQPELADYLHSLGLIEAARRLRIPKNLTLAATMNNADQGVTYIDSAFKRRWRFDYKPINLRNNTLLGKTLVQYAGEEFNLLSILEAINARLSGKFARPEDRLIGPFFITDDIAQKEPNPQSGRCAALDKVGMYLYDDVLRNFREDGAFSGSVNSLNDLLNKYPKEDVFNLGVSQWSKPTTLSEDIEDDSDSSEE